MKKINIKGLKEIVYYEKLPSGLDVYLWPNEKSNSFFASLNVKYGSIHTDFKLKNSKKVYHVPTGVAHFLEHLNFNTKDGDVYEIFDRLGSDINAFTTFEYTSYHVSGANNVEENINTLLDYVCTPYFTKELVEKEKGIILEEARSGLDNPGNIFLFKKLENALHKDKRRNRIIGTLDDIKRTTVEDIELVYNSFYHPENMFLVVTGNIDLYATMACIKENMLRKDFPKYQEPEIVEIKEPAKVFKEYEVIDGNVQDSIASVVIKMPQKKLKVSVKNNILYSLILKCNFGATSEFKNELIDNKLVAGLDFSRTSVTDNILVSINVRTKYPEEVVNMIKEKLNDLSITKEDFERKKRASIANLVFLYDDAEEVNMNIQDDIIYSKNHKIINDIKEIYENLEYEEAVELLEKLNFNNISVLIMKQKKETN